MQSINLFIFPLFIFLNLFSFEIRSEFVQDEKTEKVIKKNAVSSKQLTKKPSDLESKKPVAFAKKMKLEKAMEPKAKYEIFKSFISFSSESSITGRRTLKYESVEVGRFVRYFYPWIALGWNIGFLTESNGRLLDDEIDVYHGVATHLALYLRFPVSKARFLRIGTGLGVTNLPVNKSDFYKYGALGARFQLIFEADILHMGLSYMRNDQQDLLGFSAGFQW